LAGVDSEEVKQVYQEQVWGKAWVWRESALLVIDMQVAQIG
jgi:hypothetical protein